jgi:hypothetical protein
MLPKAFRAIVSPFTVACILQILTRLTDLVTYPAG